MEMTELKRGNMEELAQTVKELLRGKQLIYTTKDRPNWNEPWRAEVIHHDCALNDDPDIDVRHWFRPKKLEGLYANAKSSVSVLLRTSEDKPISPIVFHPCVRFGGQTYPDLGQKTKFLIQPDRVEFDVWNSTSFHTLQVV